MTDEKNNDITAYEDEGESVEAVEAADPAAQDEKDEISAETGAAGLEDPLDKERARSRALLSELMEKKRKYAARIAEAEDAARAADESAAGAREEIDKLRLENDELKSLGESYEAENERLKGALGDYLASLKAKIPEDRHSLVPEGDLVDSTRWLAKAVDEGLFAPNSGGGSGVEGAAPRAVSPIGADDAYGAELERARAKNDVVKVMEIKERINFAKRSI